MGTAPFLVEGRSGDDAPWRLLASGERTGGLVTIGEVIAPPRTAGPNWHVHTNEDEALYVFAGEMTVAVGDERHQVSSGMLAWLPRGVPHTFANLSDEPVWAVALATPAGFERLFAEQQKYTASLSGPPDREALMAISAQYGVTAIDRPSLM
jgi:quercetin dioxygenase-like cupin family protein